MTILVLQSLAILFMWPKVDIVWKKNNQPPDQNMELKMIIRDSALGVFSDGVIDARENRVYIPELKVFLPLNEDTRHIKYQYAPSDDKNSYPAEINLNTKAQIETLVETLDHVPCMQKMMRATINNPDSERYNEKRSGDMKLEDGRTLYFFENKDKKCTSRWSTSSPAKMVEIIKTAKSY